MRHFPAPQGFKHPSRAQTGPFRTSRWQGYGPGGATILALPQWGVVQWQDIRFWS